MVSTVTLKPELHAAILRQIDVERGQQFQHLTVGSTTEYRGVTYIVQRINHYNREHNNSTVNLLGRNWLVVQEVAPSDCRV